MVVVDRFTGEVRAMVGGAEPQFAGYNRAMQARRSIGSLAKPATYLTALSQPNQYRLNTWIADAPVTIRLSNGQTWSPQNDDRRFSGQVMLVDALTRSMNVPTVNLGMALGLPAVVDTWTKLGAPKNQLNAVPAMLLGALNLTPIEVAQAFQTIASGGNRAPLSALRSVIAEDGTVLYQSYPQAERAVPAQAAYMTLWTMQQVVQRGTDVLLYTAATDVDQEDTGLETAIVPNVIGMGRLAANDALAAKGLAIRIEPEDQTGTAIRQFPAAGEEVPVGAEVLVEFSKIEILN